MSDQAAPEPTMEEILASIRRIISEDDTPEPDVERSDGWRPPAPAGGAAFAKEEAFEEEDVLELTERTEPTVDEVHAHAVASGTVTASATPPRKETMREPEPATPPASPTSSPQPFAAMASDSLVAPEAAEKSASAFGRLSAALARPEAPAPPSPALPPPGRTLEDLTKDLLKPLLKAWLDENLARIVQARVDEEVERISRGKVR